ncbi:zinc ribbon domain-containing protein [Deinococcus sp. PESE-13]
MRYTYNVPISGISSSYLTRVIEAGLLEPIEETESGCSGRMYALSDEHALTPHDPYALKLGSWLLSCNLFTLPTAEYVALAHGCINFGEFETLGLIAQLLNRDTTRRDHVAELRRIVRADKSGPAKRTSATHESVWIRCQTRFCLEQTGWKVVLVFETQSLIQPARSRRTAFGIDLGLAPLAGVANGHGDAWELPGIPSLPLSDRQIAEYASNKREAHLLRHVRHEAVYTAAKLQFEGLIGQLVEQATSVHVEDLGRLQLRDRFGFIFDDVAMWNFLYAWLPQRLHEFGIPLDRHDPALTSRMCSTCYGYGLRRRADWGRLYCANCDEDMNAHQNAARVLMLLGAGTSIARLRRRLEQVSHAAD